MSDRSTQRDPLTVEGRRERYREWGPAPDHAAHLADKIYKHASRNVDLSKAQAIGRHTSDAPTVPPSRLSGSQRDALARIAPVYTDNDARRACSLGKSYPDLVAARSQALERCCDAVAIPATEDELERTVSWCADNDVALVPVGGGTTVTGGIEPIGQRADQPVVAVDTTRLASCLDVDMVGGVATFQAGIRGPVLEASLRPFGMTLGHVPQSFEYSTLGGWIATRSAGQQSLKYGKIEDLTAGLRVISPESTMVINHVPAHGAGPDLREMMLGSEGTFGVISRATMRIHRRPDVVRFAAYVLPTFEAASAAARAIVRDPSCAPAMVRVSDADETAFNIGASVPGFMRSGAASSVVRALGYERSAMVLVLSTGTHKQARSTEIAVDRIMSRRRGRSLGAYPARSWFNARFVQPYARDLLMDAGLLVDTLETSVTWGRLGNLHAAVKRALHESFASGGCIVGCHLSHLYHDGVSAYFTFMAPSDSQGSLESWRRAKRAVHAAIARCGGSASHQHGVGTMHTDLYEATTPASGIETIRAIRASLDPTGVCNPGKLMQLPPDAQSSINQVQKISGGSIDTSEHTS